MQYSRIYYSRLSGSLYHASYLVWFAPFAFEQIGDFGTSICRKHNISTGLATFTTVSSKNTQMSLAWSAPEVRSSYKSPIYLIHNIGANAKLSCISHIITQTSSREGDLLVPVAHTNTPPHDVSHSESIHAS